MPVTFESIGLGQLTLNEKLELVGELWDDLIAAMPPGGLLTPGQKEELRHRVQDAADNPDDWVSIEDAVSQTLGKLGQ
jgi:putative addiction module component (TIGR02574 family)